MKRSVTSMLAAVGILGALASGCGNSCLEESTLVRTPGGSMAIGELEVGDAVVSIDPSTGAATTTHVADVSYAWAWCEKLVVGGQSLWLTEDHPLYSPELSGFRLAESWLSGELHETLSDGGDLVATSSGSWIDQRPCRVVDLTVDAEPHTFVAAGIVVHNKSIGEPACVNDEDCLEGDVCNGLGDCVPDGGTGGSGGEGGASGRGGAGGKGGMGGG